MIMSNVVDVNTSSRRDVRYPRFRFHLIVAEVAILQNTPP